MVSTLLFPCFLAWANPEPKQVLPDLLSKCCTDQSFMQSYLNYLIKQSDINEQMHSLTNNTSVMLIEPHCWCRCHFSGFSLYVPLMCFASSLTLYPSEIWTSNLSLFSEFTSPCKPYMLIDTEILGHMYSVETQSRLGITITYGPRSFFLDGQ